MVGKGHGIYFNNVRSLVHLTCEVRQATDVEKSGNGFRITTSRVAAYSACYVSLGMYVLNVEGTSFQLGKLIALGVKNLS